jgi:hypothetical protein
VNFAVCLVWYLEGGQRNLNLVKRKPIEYGFETNKQKGDWVERD